MHNTILIVDDDESMRTFLSTLLQGWLPAQIRPLGSHLGTCPEGPYEVLA